MPRPEEVLKHVRAAFACEPRINLYRYPVLMTFKDGILALDGEVKHIVARHDVLVLLGEDLKFLVAHVSPGPLARLRESP